MTITRTWFGLCAAALLLAACGSDKPREGVSIDSGDDGVTATVTDKDGNQATMRYGGEEGIAAPTNLPDFAPVYPDAQIISVVTGSEAENKGMVNFRTTASMADVMNFYRDKAKAAGLSVEAEVQMGAGRMLALTDKASGRALQLTANPDEAEGGVMVGMVYDAGAKG